MYVTVSLFRIRRQSLKKIKLGIENGAFQNFSHIVSLVPALPVYPASRSISIEHIKDENETTFSVTVCLTNRRPWTNVKEIIIYFYLFFLKFCVRPHLNYNLVGMFFKILYMQTLPECDSFLFVSQKNKLHFLQENNNICFYTSSAKFLSDTFTF